LTFDDGFRDHYETVYPILKRRDLSGIFFPPADPIQADIVLDVHKLHLILSECEDDEELSEEVFALLEQFADRFDLADPETYYERLAEEGRWDTADVVFLKRLLQRDLPAAARGALVTELFEQYVDVSEETLSREWYMTPDQLRVMIDDGMYVGSHGATHRWFDTLSSAEVADEIESSLAFLDRIGAPTEEWIMCYPYGAYDETTLNVLSDYDCLAGLTTTSGVADLGVTDPFEYPRVDTNELPIDG
jgi:hypothetical protein